MTRATFTAPAGADGVLLTSDPAPWVFGPFSADIIPENTVPHRFSIFRLTVIESNADSSEIELYDGPNDDVLATIPVPKTSVGTGVVIPTITASVASNSRVRAKFRDGSTRSRTCSIKVSCSVEATPGYRNHNAE